MTTVTDKKLDNWGFREENYVASGELTVTITLGEYRELVKYRERFENERTNRVAIDTLLKRLEAVEKALVSDDKEAENIG